MSDITLPPCAGEGSSMCYWDATLHGNGLGQSYYTSSTKTVALTVPEGKHITSVTLTDDTHIVTFSEAVAVSLPEESTPISPAYDLTLPLVIITTALVISVVGITAAFFSRRA